jgi:hypothetical protein
MDRIVGKALRKDKEERYQAMKDLALDLKSLSEEMEFEARLDRSLPSDPGRTESDDARQRREVRAGGATITGERFISRISQHKRVAVLILAAIVIAVAVAVFLLTRGTPVLTERDTILISDFDNKTGDDVFDGTLKQALAVHLGQSPFLNIFPDDRIWETLRLMGRKPDDRVTRDVAREVCERQGVKAMLTGTISSFGSRYLILLEAISARTGEAIAREQIEAESREEIIGALGEAASKLRERLGESLSTIERFDAPLEQATTSSLEALRAFTLGDEMQAKGNFREAI